MLGKEDTGDEKARDTQSPSARLQNGTSAKVTAMSTSRNTKKTPKGKHSASGALFTESRILTHSFLSGKKHNFNKHQSMFKLNLKV